MKSKDPRHARPGVLEDYVVPVCEFVVEAGQARLVKLEGTAFFAAPDGVFVTAAHVLRSIEARRTETKNPFGLVVKDHQDARRSLLSPIQWYDYAPAPFDIAVGKVSHYSRCWFHQYRGPQIGCWSEVATLGYPETALNPLPAGFNAHVRGLRGYVQRPIDPDELPALRPHPRCFETSFAVTAGMSGAPLFATLGVERHLIGVCIGSYCGEVVDYRHTTVAEDGAKYEERQTRVEQYGIAQAIDALADWKPNVPGAVTFGELPMPLI